MVQLVRHFAPRLLHRHIRTITKGSDYPTRPPYVETMNTFDDIVKETVNETTKTVTMPPQHHFDTYTVVQDLRTQGFSKEQAVVIMKGVKFKLRESVAQLHQELLLKSALENVRKQKKKKKKIANFKIGKLLVLRCCI